MAERIAERCPHSMARNTASFSNLPREFQSSRSQLAGLSDENTGGYEGLFLDAKFEVSQGFSVGQTNAFIPGRDKAVQTCFQVEALEKVIDEGKGAQSLGL